MKRKWYIVLGLLGLTLFIVLNIRWILLYDKPKFTEADQKTIDLLEKLSQIGTSGEEDGMENCDQHFLSYNSDPILDWRNACGIEATARIHPESDICIHGINFQEEILQDLLGMFGNVKTVQINLRKLFADTPLQQYYETGLWKLGRQPLYDLSDALRFGLLYYYNGGAYMDLDQVMIKNINQIYGDKDVLFRQELGSTHEFATGLTIFKKESDLLSFVVSHFVETFSLTGRFGQVGPGLLTYAYRNSPKDSVSEVILEGTERTYRIHWQSPNLYLLNIERSELGRLLYNEIKENSIGYHVWKWIDVKNIYRGSIIERLFKEFCPYVHSKKLVPILKKNEENTYGRVGSEY